MAQSISFYIFVPTSIVEALGLLLTAWRIYFRLRIQRFWWEDAWAVALLITSLISIVIYWIYLVGNVSTSIAASWIYTICFTCIVTFARMSVLFSIIRIIHGNSRLRGFSYFCVAFFAACWAILIVEKVWYCTSDPSWHHKKVASSRPFCVVEETSLIFEFTTECIAISILVAFPLHILWKVKLPRRQRRLILSIFASSVVLAFGAVFHAIGHIINNHIVSTAGLHVEVALSIIVCNLLVVVTYAYQFLRRDSQPTRSTEETFDDDFTTLPTRESPVPATTVALTTVDLEISLSSTGQQPNTKFESSSASRDL